MRRGRVGWVRWRGVGDERPRKLPDQIVCEARGSARGTFGASRISQWAPRELFSPPLARAIITDLIKMKSETGHVGGSGEGAQRIQGGQ